MAPSSQGSEPAHYPVRLNEELEDALRSIVPELQVIRAVRGDRVGDYYLIPKTTLSEDIELRTGLRPPTGD